MKKALPLVILAFSSGLTLHAQWTTDLAQNTTVRASPVGDISSHLVSDGPEGSTYDCWFENDGHGYQLRMQRLNAEGDRLWPDTGLVVSAFPQNSATFRYGFTSDAEGNAVVAFQDERTAQLDIVAYKIGPDGSFLWGPDGVLLPTPGSTGLSPSVAALSNGNCVVAWGTSHSPGRVAFQIVGPTGSMVLTEATMLSAATRLSRPVPVATSDGGFILQYELEGANFLAPSTMYAQRYDDAGLPVWTDPIVVSTQTIAGFYFPQPVADGHDGAYLAFNTSNPDNPGFTDVYLQRIRGNGSLWSAEGTRLDNSDATQKFTAGKGLVLVNDEEGSMVPLQVTDGSQGQSGVSVQRVDTAGVLQLGNAAIPVIAVSASYVQPWDISATSDGAVILHSSGAFGQQHIGATRVDLLGQPLWIPAQHDISTANSNKDDIAVTGTRDGQAVVVWQDDRTPSGIYAQNIMELTTAVRSIPLSSTDLRLEQNPTENPVLLLDGAVRDATHLDVFDIQGRTVYSSTLPTTDRVTLPLSRLNPGVYTLRVTGNGCVGTVRWVK